MDVSSASLRRKAFAKLAELSTHASVGKSSEDVDRLTECLPKPQPSSYLDGVLRAIAPSSRLPMSLRELDVLLALCTTAPKLTEFEHAQRLASQLGDYLPEAHTQVLSPSPYLHEIKPSPWAALTSQLTQALLVLGQNFPDLKTTVKETVSSFVYNWTQSSSALAKAITAEDDELNNEQEAVEIAAVAVSMIGFMQSAAQHESFWTSSERLALIKAVKAALSEQFMVAIEKATSIIRHSAWNDPVCKDWRRSLKHYAANGAPFGAMLLQQSFMVLVVSCVSRLLFTNEITQRPDLVRHYMNSHISNFVIAEESDDDMIEYFVDLLTTQMDVLEDGSDYLQLSSAWQQRLAFSTKALALEAFLYCLIIDEDIAESETLQAWLEDAIQSQPQMSNPELCKSVMEGFAILAKFSPDNATNFARVLLRFIVQGTSLPAAVDIAANSLGVILHLLPQDAVITTLYSLGNVLSSQSSSDKQNPAIPLPLTNANGHQNSLSSANRERTGSVLSLSWSGDEETSLICGNVARAIAAVAVSFKDAKIIALSQTMLIQKIGRIGVLVDAHIIEQAAHLAIHGKENEFKLFLRLLTRVHQGAVQQQNSIILEAVRKARQHIAEHVDNLSPLFKAFALQLLERVLSKGDAVEVENKQLVEVEQAAQEIGPLLKPLAIIASRQPFDIRRVTTEDNAEIATLSREAWFNVAVHGITQQSQLGQQYHNELKDLAMYSHPLIDASRAELMESDVELNTVLRRSMTAQHTVEQKRHLTSIIPEKDSVIRHLSYQKVVFLNAVYLVESLRAQAGNCTDILQYFVDPSLQTSHLGSCLAAIAEKIIKTYVQEVSLARNDNYAAPHVARQLVNVLTACCHRSAKMQEVARLYADHIIANAPSVLCQKSALFALLELLTLMWSSCLEAEIDEYGWKSVFTSIRGKVTIEQSDDYAFRRRTLDLLHGKARQWMTSVIAVAPLDIKGLLQTYLSEFDDTGSYGHISLGRSFAAEMGALIPTSDQRLVAVEHERQSTHVDVASDFIAQYTTRQEYRFAGASNESPIRMKTSAAPSVTLDESSQALLSASSDDQLRRLLSGIHQKVFRQVRIPETDLQNVLRRAAALLCRSKSPQTAIVQHLVQIPFGIMNKNSIKMGISLWLGVIHENSRVEPRILTEVAQGWERTIDRHVGIFNPAFVDLNPFYVKMEFAPSDREDLHKQQENARNTISPFLRILKFFESHFNAVRLGSINTQRTIVRMLHRTLDAFANLRGHPLLREIHFHVVLFGLKVLQFSTCLNKTTIWRLRDKVISTGLHWFSHPPYWSYGSNRLQLKAEVKLMQDVLAALSVSKNIRLDNNNNATPATNWQIKQELLETLIQSEIGRLQSWLQPVGALTTGTVRESVIANFAPTAWSETPALAVQLATRFPLPQVRNEVRALLCNLPDKALQEAAALDLLLGDALPKDLNFQLKYLLLWNPVNPIQAVTYFMPAFGNHAYILQYAMRALESHSVEVTFFYVPQIVQCLRYDALGYVERYIVETGKFSQLFAHQIIWNMKANAYKDDDSTIEDPIKPTLDKVMDNLVNSFSGEDRDFYEREFAFFGEVTDISGKLKPYIKKSKPEKKAKIEEELRKIKVEVGVYLPSNPDGKVVGIDRKSGKPLQSHAKAPYMATFRIRKTRNATDEETEKMIEDTATAVARPKMHKKNQSSSAISVTSSIDDGNTYEVWQSAIFKVGDDCRQDVLALQMIAAFRGIFNSVGLDVYVFPYRVTATAPGCGVIDVLPNSISRDMLGRETVNGLHDYFVTKYGGEHSVRYQEARGEFVKSMAAYSVISYLLQFKDRHNGNIMIDDKGHILHIDFGFCFDIAPGGVKFERAPFKLTPEMLAVMGGSNPNTSQAYRWFEELTIKAFLATRQYCDKLCHLVTLMLDSGLPCFKPETIKNFRSRFVLERTEKQAADFMLACIKRSAGNFSTKVYDEFQLMTNGIPY